MMNKFKVGKKVLVKELNKIGIITKLDQNGLPQEVIIEEEIVDVIGLTFKLIGLIKSLIELFKNIFKRRKNA